MTQSTAAERKARAEEAERLYLETLNRIETDDEMKLRLCGDLLEDVDTRPVQGWLKAARWLSTQSNSDETLRRQAAGFVRFGEAMAKRARELVIAEQRRAQMEADMAGGNEPQ